MRGATAVLVLTPVVSVISIHAPHAGCDSRISSILTEILISIHAPHAGCDLCSVLYGIGRKISIHAPHAGCDGYQLKSGKYLWVFQSTHPMRGATEIRELSGDLAEFQSTHPMRGATNLSGTDYDAG